MSVKCLLFLHSLGYSCFPALKPSIQPLQVCTFVKCLKHHIHAVSTVLTSFQPCQLESLYPSYSVIPWVDNINWCGAPWRYDWRSTVSAGFSPVNFTPCKPAYNLAFSELTGRKRSHWAKNCRRGISRGKIPLCIGSTPKTGCTALMWSKWLHLYLASLSSLHHGRSVSGMVA